MGALSAEQAYLKAYDHYLAGRLERALSICRQVLASDPRHALGAYLAAVIEHRLGNHAQGDQLLQHATAQRPYSIRLSYPPPRTPRHATTPNPGLEAILSQQVERYRALVQSFARWLPWLKKIPDEAASDGTPCWNNIWIPPLDGIAIYCMIAEKRPRHYVEVGSGNSTRFAARAIHDHGLATKIISIDLSPRAEIDALCDEVVRKPLEETDLSVFATLGADDIVFIDNSHCCFTNSDVTVFFTEVLPALAAGVTVGIHDIFLPYDYPESWVERYYSEQYLLACYLLAGAPRFRILLPAFYAGSLPQMAEALAALSAGPPPTGIAFWLEMN